MLAVLSCIHYLKGLMGTCVPGAKPSIRVDNAVRARLVRAESGAASWESVGVPRTAALGASWPPSTTSAADTARILATLSFIKNVPHINLGLYLSA
jgi:hypothetical protein